MYRNIYKGVTIIELLVTIIIIGIIAVAAVSIHTSNQKIYVKEGMTITMRENVFGAIKVLTDEIRLAGYNPQQIPTFEPPIRWAWKNVMIMRMDTNSNGVLDTGEERAYRLANYTLYRYAPDSVPVARNIDYLEFRYYNLAGNQLPTPVPPESLSSISAVKIIIVGKSEHELGGYYSSGTYPDGTPYNDKYLRYWDSTFVKLRNL